MTEYPLRTKRKARTREKLITVANRIFLKKGFDDTTLEEISDKAEVHVQTLLRHFRTKEDLALARQQEALDLFREGLQSPDREENAEAFWWHYVRSWLPDFAMNDPDVEYLKLLETVPVLRAKYLYIQRQYQDLLAAELAKEAGLDPALDIYAQLRADTLVNVQFSTSMALVMAHREKDIPAVCESVARIMFSHFPSREDFTADIQKSLTEQQARRLTPKQASV